MRQQVSFHEYMMRKLSLILINMQIWPLLTEQAKHWAEMDYLAQAMGFAKLKLIAAAIFALLFK